MQEVYCAYKSMRTEGNVPVAIVTGAGSGIGREISLVLAEQGFCLVLAGRRATCLKQTAALVSVPRLVIPTDVGDCAQVSQMVVRTLQYFGRIDLLVNNAGTIFDGDISKHTPEAILETFQVNAIGAAYAIHAVWPTFVEQHSGCIVNISSSASLPRAGGQPFAYAASKAALDQMTRCCALEGKAVGVRAFCVNPGYVDTPMLQSLVASGRAQPRYKLSPQEVAQVVVDCVLGRRDKWLGTPNLLRSTPLIPSAAGRIRRFAKRIYKGM